MCRHVDIREALLCLPRAQTYRHAAQHEQQNSVGKGPLKRGAAANEARSSRRRTTHWRRGQRPNSTHGGTSETKFERRERSGLSCFCARRLLLNPRRPRETQFRSRRRRRPQTGNQTLGYSLAFPVPRSQKEARTLFRRLLPLGKRLILVMGLPRISLEHLLERPQHI